MSSELKTCRHCGEGVTTHCRAPVGMPCPDGLPPMPRARTKTMDNLVKVIHRSPRFCFEGACKAIEEASRLKDLRKEREA